MRVAEFRARLRYEFEANRYTEGLAQTNSLLLKGTMELIETHNRWKQTTHLLRYFETGEWAHLQQRAANPLLASSGSILIGKNRVSSPQSPFLAGFLNNRQ